jgi:capsular polysaccharide biosynthesis protein
LNRLSRRVLLNEAELQQRLSEIGFEIVQPESLPAAEQIRAFFNAEIIVGPSGAGMFNVVFCKPGTRVIDIESEPHWIGAHMSLFASCGLDYGIFEGKVEGGPSQQHHRPWRVNVPALIERIKKLIPEKD